MAVAQQEGEKFVGFAFPKGREPQLGVVRLLSPLMAVFGPIVHQQQDLSRGDTLTQRVEELLRFAVNPMQVFKDQDQGLFPTLAQEQPLERVKGAPGRICGSICCNGEGCSSIPSRANRYGRSLRGYDLSSSTLPMTFSRRVPVIVVGLQAASNYFSNSISGRYGEAFPYETE